MSPPSRRQVLGWGLAGGAMTAAGAAGLLWGTGPRGGPGGGSGGTGGGDWGEPEVLTSAGGVLDLDLEAAPAAVGIDGRTAHVWAFNGTVPGPTLELSPGDTLRVRMTNGLGAPTNLHVHGLHVSPAGAGDNPFVTIEPGGTHDYEFVLPPDHPPGTYWYHPHHHGTVAEQLAAGLYGAIVVREAAPPPVSRERVLVVSDLALTAAGELAEPSVMERMMGREGSLVLVNGRRRPRLAAAPGERERWRIINACPSRFLRLGLDGQSVRLLARDLGRLHQPVEAGTVELAPGNRVDLLVEAAEGTSTLVASPVDRGAMPGMMGGRRPGGTGPVDLLTLEVTGGRAPALADVPAGPEPQDLRGVEVARRRTLDFAMGGMGGAMMRGDGSMMSFTVNGREFDAGRTDVDPAFGDVEEWTLVNSSPMDHPVHLHVWPMQVVSGGGGDDGAGDEPRWADVVTVPALGRVTVRVAFEGIAGRTVLHCHILDHEDLGMMATVEVR
ncbi:multicopper oxidase family protein [Citricoccus sp. SGAir0253]|uniref:multicopper oxidase family protein n=1 Tax=Citricoccus sp. SGAir0253 TaxID=2567881 RepID=UPI0010CCD48F|nr:multicopper oxidase family protein [Citricoccus sp. SGAir0253]QCU79123.1 multicopper oxidase family protein [Citricoccus sp. SGAir0253]